MGFQAQKMRVTRNDTIRFFIQRASQDKIIVAVAADPMFIGDT